MAGAKTLTTSCDMLRQLLARHKRKGLDSRRIHLDLQGSWRLACTGDLKAQNSLAPTIHSTSYLSYTDA